MSSLPLINKISYNTTMMIKTKSEAGTKKLGLTLAKKAHGGDIIGLIGNLGTGKTCFTKGFARGLGIKSLIASPTFILLKTYTVKKGVIKNFCHVDVYRLNKTQDILELGLLECLERKDTVTIIEWADKIFPLLSNFRRTTFLNFSLINSTTRIITITKKPPANVGG